MGPGPARCQGRNGEMFEEVIGEGLVSEGIS